MQICSRAPARSLLLLFAVLAALALAACGDDDSGGTEGPDPATVTPADAPLYFDAVIRPEGDQKDGINEALSKLTGEEDPGGFITSQLESELSDEGVSYSDDIEPWLGSTAGGFVSEITSAGDGEGAVAVAVTDEDAARDAIDKLATDSDEELSDETYEGVAYKLEAGSDSAAGIVGDFLVAGTKGGFEAAVDASNGDSLADDSAATDALDSSVENSLFRTYVDGAALYDLAVASDAFSKQDLESLPKDQLDALGDSPVVFSGALSADDATLEFSGPAVDGEGGTEIVGSLPSEAWLAFGVPRLGDAIAAGYETFVQGFEAGFEATGPQGFETPDIDAELRDALGLDIARDFGWAGDLGFFVQGTSVLGLGGGLVIETDDEQAAADAVDRLRSTLAKQRGIQISDTADGFELSTRSAPVGAEVAVTDGKVVVAGAGITVDEILAPSETLADSEEFGTASDALGEGVEAAIYLDFGAISSLVESSGQAGADPSIGQALAILDSLTYLVAGNGTDGDRSIGRIVLGIGEGGDSGSGAAASIAP